MNWVGGTSGLDLNGPEVMWLLMVSWSQSEGAKGEGGEEEMAAGSDLKI